MRLVVVEWRFEFAQISGSTVPSFEFCPNSEAQVRSGVSLATVIVTTPERQATLNAAVAAAAAEQLQRSNLLLEQRLPPRAAGVQCWRSVNLKLQLAGLSSLS